MYILPVSYKNLVFKKRNEKRTNNKSSHKKHQLKNLLPKKRENKEIEYRQGRRSKRVIKSDSFTESLTLGAIYLLRATRFI